MTVGAEGGILVVARLCRGAASPVKKGGCAPLLFLVRRSTYVVYYRWRTVSELWYDGRMNENSASSKEKPTPAIVAASMNAGKRGRANGKSQLGDNRGGARRSGRTGKRRPLTVRSLDELAARHTSEAKALGQEIFVTFLKEAFADRRTGNKVYYSRETTLTRETFVPFLCAHRQWRNHEGDFAPDGKLSGLTFGWRSGDKARTEVARAVYQKLRNARDLTAEEDLYRVSYAWPGKYPDKPNGGYRALVNDGDTAYTLCRVLTGPNAREIARTIVRDTTGEDGSSWFVTVMQDLYDNGRYCGIAKNGMFRSLARSYGVNTGADIDSYEAFMKDALENGGKNIKRLFGSGRMTPRVAAMARVANRELGVGYYGKSMWLDIEASRDTWCDTDEKLEEFVACLFEFATPEQVLSWWCHANKYDAGYSRYGAYGDHQGYDRMYWYADAFDREARKRYPFNSEQFARLYNAGDACQDKHKAKGLKALGCDLTDSEMYDLFKSVGGTTWHNDKAPFSNRLWWERITNNGELTGLREVAENNAMRPGWHEHMLSAHDWAFLVRHIEQMDASDADVLWLINHENIDTEGCVGCSWGSVVRDALWARYDTQGREGMRHLFALLGLGDEDGLIDLGELPYGMWKGTGKRPTLDLAYQDTPEAANLWLGMFPYDKFGFSHRDNVRTWANTLTDDEKKLLDSLPSELREAWNHLAAGDGEGGYFFRWEHDYGDAFLNASAAFAVAMTTGHVGADMLSWLGDNDGVRAFMLAHASSMFSPEFPWTADWERGVHSVPWWVVKGLNGDARAALLHDVKDSAYAIGAYRDKWPTSIEDAADADARMGIIRSHAGGRDMKVTVEIGVGPYYACRGKEEERYKMCKANALSVPAGWMWAELAGYWGRMDGLDARTVFARDFLNTLRSDLARGVDEKLGFADGFFSPCVPDARKAVEADKELGALSADDGKVMLEELDEVLELNL